MRPRATGATLAGLALALAACGPQPPSLAAASDGAVEVARGLEAALRSHDGHAAVALCDRSALERGVGPVPRRLHGGDDLEVIEWRGAPKTLAQGLGAVVGSFTEVSVARVRVAGIRGGGSRLELRVHLRAFGRVADGRMREDDGFLRLAARRNSAGRWRIEAATPEDLLSTLRREPAFRDLTRSAGLAGGGFVATGRLRAATASLAAGLVVEDLDGDGRVDLVVPAADGCHLLRNRGDGRFADAGSVPCAGDALGIAAADLDGDGLVDLVVASAAGPLEVWRGEGGFGFRRAPAPVVTGARAVVVVDVDGDGFPDVIATRGARGIALLRGGPDGLADATAGAGLRGPAYALGVCAGDVDHDGRPDLFVTGAGEPGRFFRNLGGGRFADATRAAGVRAPALGASCAFADVDGDGHTDLVVAAAYDDSRWLVERADLALGARARLREHAARADLHRALAGSTLWHGHGDGTFVAVPHPRLAGAGWAAAALPFEREAGLDLLVSCGLRTRGPRDLTGLLLTRGLPRTPLVDDPGLDPGDASVAGHQPQRLLVGAGGRLVPAGDATLWRVALDGRAALAADLDGDGLLDHVLRGADGDVRLLRNEATPRSFVRLRLLGRGGAPALGAQVEATSGGRQALRHLTPSSHLGSGPAEVHRALGRTARLDRLRVRWPDVSVQEVLDLPARRLVTVRQGSDRVTMREIPRWTLEDSPASAPAPLEEAPATRPSPPTSEPAAPPPGAGLALPLIVRDLLRRDLGLVDRNGAPARPRPGTAATIVYFTDGPGCARDLERLTQLQRRLGTEVGLVGIQAPKAAPACPQRVAPVLVAPPGTLGALLPAAVLYDRDGRAVWVQLGLVDTAVLEREATRLLRAP
ncbi:MAG: VCBS repeat-containing protein [Deltaproteobacteria bacterium]|nr:VCBS repeat-containing protein [Deltaproteobacteria bacterium]